MDNIKETMNKMEKRFDGRLNSHSKRLHNLEQYRSRNEALMEQMIKQIENLANSIKWGSATIILTLVGFFIWYIQQL